MASFTKKAIKQSLIKLLNERPMNQITVKDVVEDCGINRNSFYYHYQDLPSLVEEIVLEEADQIIQKYPEVESLEQCLAVAAEFALKNKKAALHLYHSTNRESFEKSLMRVCEHVVATYTDRILQGQSIDPEDRAVFIRYYKCECFGQMIDWMDSGMKKEALDQLHRLLQLRKGMAEELLRRRMTQTRQTKPNA